MLRRNLKAAIRSGARRDAADLLERLREEDPLSIETRGLELDFLLLCQHRDEARTLAGQLLRLHPASARVHYLAGRSAYLDRDYATAASRFREADRIHPHDTARRWLGKSLSQVGELAEAESVLTALVASHPPVHRDLAWVYERMEDTEQALHHVKAHLAHYPGDPLASAQRLRLQSRRLGAGELLEEVEALEELGEEVPAELAETYVRRLLETGNGPAARRFVEESTEGMPARELASIAWTCYRLKAFDLALGLFHRILPERLEDVKLLSAIENAAKKCERVPELLERYEVLAREQPKLFGRGKRLAKHTQG